MVSLRNFMVSCITFKSLIHFELIFMYHVTQWSSFILLHVDTQFFQHHLLKRLSFLRCVFLACKLIVQSREDVLQGSRFCSVGLGVYFCSGITWFRNYSFVVQFQVKVHDISSFVHSLICIFHIPSSPNYPSIRHQHC